MGIHINVQYVRGVSFYDVKCFPESGDGVRTFYTRDLVVVGEDGERTQITLFSHDGMALLTPGEQEQRVILDERAAHDDKAEASLADNIDAGVALLRRYGHGA